MTSTFVLLCDVTSVHFQARFVMPDSELLKQLISTPSWSPSLQITLLFSLSMNRIISVHKIPGKQNHIVFIWLISFILISSKFIFVAACARILVHFEGQEILCYVSVAHFLDPVGYRWILGGGQLPLSGYSERAKFPLCFFSVLLGNAIFPIVSTTTFFSTVAAQQLGSHGCSTRVLPFPYPCLHSLPFL